MATRHERMQKLLRHYRDVTGIKEVDMHELARFAAGMGWSLPVPAQPIDLLAKEFSRAAREEIRHDSITKRPYRVNHAFTVSRNGQQMTLWIDIEEAPRKPMEMSVTNRREQVVSDLVQVSFDVEHWNRINPTDEPIIVQTDMTDDVAWRMNGPTEDEQQAS